MCFCLFLFVSSFLKKFALLALMLCYLCVGSHNWCYFPESCLSELCNVLSFVCFSWIQPRSYLGHDLFYLSVHVLGLALFILLFSTFWIPLFEVWLARAAELVLLCDTIWRVFNKWFSSLTWICTAYMFGLSSTVVFTLCFVIFYLWKFLCVDSPPPSVIWKVCIFLVVTFITIALHNTLNPCFFRQYLLILYIIHSIFCFFR